jgi:hypothetical protein
MGLLFTVVVHAAVLGAMLWGRSSGAEKPPALGQFVDAQLVRFGKPRDLSFLPHKQGVVKQNVKPDAIKVATDEKALPHLDEKKQPEEKYDPLKKTHAEMFKNLNDQPEAAEEQTGSLTGSRAGTASEAKGDPYILSLIDKLHWTVPTTIPDAELNKLSADVCFIISSDGTLQKYEMRRKSGNSQFDSSLEATLSTFKASQKFDPPPDRWKGKQFCPEFTAALAANR